jgi:glycosyltransferase involved in cell wall biosynthesis
LSSHVGPENGARVDLDPAASGWLEEFERTRGRALRVLHIGNIANNAYINAKIQRRYGIEADVLSYDYYHVMGTPEWEDSDFDGDVGDESFPDWSGVDLRGFERPRWFVQGRLKTCRSYLAARRSGTTDRRADLLWRKLSFERWLLCRRSAPAAAGRALLAVVRRARRFARRLIRALLGAKYHARAAARRILVIFQPNRRPARTGATTAATSAALEQRFRQRLDGADGLTLSDYADYLADSDAWQPVLQAYDVIQAYALDPAVPFFAGFPYAAYEHGTIRTIPFEDDARGRLAAVAYREAGAVFVTNIDNLDAARRLGIAAERIVPLPHAADSARLDRFAETHPDVVPAAGPVRVFSPARQDWRDGDPNWAKGNDRLLRAARDVRDEGFDCTLTLVAWGRDLEASRRLVAQLGLEDAVTWCPPLRKDALWLEYLRSHVIADQFVLNAFGSVTFESLALGRRVITSLDVSTAAAFFGEAPPLIAAGEQDEIASALRRVIEDPDDTQGVGQASRDWFRRYHSSARIVSLEVSAYRGIAAQEPAGSPS